MSAPALSLMQPWAELLVQGKKTIELRKWNTHYRGRFYVHASKSMAMFSRVNLPEFKVADLAFGALIGEAVISDVKQYQGLADYEADISKHLIKRYANLTTTKVYGFMITDARKFARPIHATGMLNFFKPDPVLLPELMAVSTL